MSTKQTTKMGDHPESLELIYALNRVATSLQKSIQSEENVYSVFQKQVVALGLRGGISLFDEVSGNLIFQTVAFTNPMKKILSRFEKSAKTRAEGYSIPISKVDVYQKVVIQSETVFVADTSTVSVQVIPRQLRSITAPLLGFLGSPPGIFVPLVFDGKVKGMLNIVGRNLTKKDVPTMQAFANQIAVALENARLVNRLQSAHDELETAYQATLEGWVKALDLRDEETEGHSQRVTETTVQLANFMGINQIQLPHIQRGALLHDIGKMAVPDNILRKPGPLDETEWKTMRQHPVTAWHWLSRIQYLHSALDIPHRHHERWNGSGYPDGLMRDEIPMSARVFAVVDVWDAMSSDRPYRKAIPKKQVLQHIGEQAGLLFDPQVADAFMQFHSEKKGEL
jgi:HD-GYP domain-containing protein (c-di-GMP phosphodiesterase class II)